MAPPVADKQAAAATNPPNAATRAVLRKLGARTFIKLLAKVHPDGHIDVEIVTSSGYSELDSAVLQDLRSWRWEPAEVAGKPVYSEKTFKMNLQAE